MKQCLGHLQKMRQRKTVSAKFYITLLKALLVGANLLTAIICLRLLSVFLQQLYPANPKAGERDFDDLDKFGLRENDIKVTEKPEILFARLDLEEVMKEVEKIQEAQKKASWN